MINFIGNKENRYPTRNHYHCIHEYIEDPNTVDGDDALAHIKVLEYLDNVYSETSPKIYLTYGQFIKKIVVNLGFVTECQN